MTDSFYRAFEERFRGSRELIKSRLQVYLPFVLPLLELSPCGAALDLGCGRGEWIQLLNEHGFDAQGVDLDDSMLQDCRVNGLNVQTGDALTFIRDVPDASQLVVSGFHIAEHLPFDILKQIVAEAKRVLKPGGLLILETPNPENISVGTNSFYLDPTHQRPIPPQLLSFVPEYYGYARVKVVRLQESIDIRSDRNLSLIDVISGVSLDYAVVAQAEMPSLPLHSQDSAFASEYGVTLSDIAERYQRQLQNIIERAEAKAEQAEAKAEQAEAKAEQAEAKAEQVRADLNSCIAQIHAIYVSKSHKITAPLRWMSFQARTLCGGGLRLFRKVFCKSDQ